MSTWSGIRQKLEQDLLAPCLRGHIQYYAVSYSKCPDHEGRASMRFDGKEILKCGYYEMSKRFWSKYKMLCNDMSDKKAYEEAGYSVLNDGYFDQRDFYVAFEEFDNQSISDSLFSRNSLVRMMAILDRRVGKRTLVKLAERFGNEPLWLRQFYYIRMDAEGLV